MAGQAIRLSEELVKVSRGEAKVMNRSVAGQVEHWLRLGRAVERSGLFDYRQVRAALAAEISVDDLTGEEQEIYGIELGEALRTVSDEDRAYFREMERRDRALGIDVESMGDPADD